MSETEVSGSGGLPAGRRGLRRRARAVLTAGALLAVGACAAPIPLVLDPRVAAPPLRPLAKGVVYKGCAIRFTEVIDARRVPETLGLITGRAVMSPPDSVAWIRSALPRLVDHGFTVAVAEEESAVAPVFSGTVSLQTAWVTNVLANKAATVVLHIEGQVAGGQSITRNYRGDLTNINWATSDNELKVLVDRAFVEAIDVMAADLRRYCPA
ncbi:MAG: hypothetical protein Q8L66_13605 [Caulobacter sp.]|nr:hypothetical protein [Caulobacter sp.]